MLHFKHYFPDIRADGRFFTGMYSFPLNSLIHALLHALLQRQILVSNRDRFISREEIKHLVTDRTEVGHKDQV